LHIPLAPFFLFPPFFISKRRGFLTDWHWGPIFSFQILLGSFWATAFSLVSIGEGLVFSSSLLYRRDE